MKKFVVVFFLTISFFGLQAQKPCSFKYGANEADSLKCIEEITMFRTSFEQQNYVDAYKAWQNVVSSCPCSWSAIFSYSQTMFDALIKSTKDSLQRERYIDTLFWGYDVRHIYFPTNFTEGSGLGFKAFNTMQYRSRNAEAAYDWFTTSIEMEKEKTQPHIWNVFFRTAEYMTQRKKDTTIIIEAYERATEYIEAAVNEAYKQYERQLTNLENLDSAVKMQKINSVEYNQRLKILQDDTARQIKLATNYRKTLSNIESIFAPYAPCSVLVQVYGKKLESSRDNVVALRKMVSTMSKEEDCMRSPVFQQALDLLHQKEPGAQTAFQMGRFSLLNRDADKAIEYLKEAIGLFETNEQRASAYYFLGLAYQFKGGSSNYSEARNAANNALKIKPNFGKAHILIGKLYELSAGMCSGGDMVPFATSWVAADRYNRAISMDPSVADEARAQMRGLTFPASMEKHKRGLSDGDEYRVTCWIQETTRVR